jgi:dinuclear metal center YbgI/SA1388 family protein
MTTVADLLAHLDRAAPFDSAADWDPVGLQIGDPNQSIDQVAVCHEVTGAVIDRLGGESAQALVAYHPLLFEPTTRLIAGDSREGRALRLASQGISLIVVHTAFDVAADGTADALASALGLSNLRPFSDVPLEDSGVPIGRIGETSESLRNLTSLVAAVVGVPTRVTRPLRGDPQPGPLTVALVPGSGASLIEAAAAQGADVLVTGDVSHHRAQAARDLGVAVIDGGHIPTERPGMARLVELVSEMAEVVDLTDLDPHPWEAPDG